MFGQDSVVLGMPCAETGVGLDDPDGSFPAQLILFLYNSVISTEFQCTPPASKTL